MQVKINKEFMEKLNLIYTKEELDTINKGFSTVRKTTFRINLLRTTEKEVLDALKEASLEVEKIPYLTDGYVLLNGREKDLWDLDIFPSGKIYMQGITSQFIGEIVRNTIAESGISRKELKVLDLTAAPGAKTSHISAILENEGEIVANELNKVRLDKLIFTLDRQGCNNVKVIAGDARQLKSVCPSGYFDIIVADLPCSAEGRINLEREKSYAFLDKAGINKRNYKRQADILKHSINLLKVGGSLIYSTCTLDPQENEGILHFLLSHFPNLEIKDISETFKHKDIAKYTKPGLKTYKKYIYRNEIKDAVRILPSEDTEGFFIARLVKKD